MHLFLRHELFAQFFHEQNHDLMLFDALNLSCIEMITASDIAAISSCDFNDTRMSDLDQILIWFE